MQYQIPQEGFVLNIDKPYGWSSFQVVNYFKWAIRRKTGLKKFKIGHAGTLDPLATGILLICVGKKTKSIPEIQSGDKAYAGSMVLGYHSPSHDLEKKLQKVDFQDFSEEDLLIKANELSGEYEQVAPVFSAKKINGKRAFEHARKGVETLELKKNKINISKFGLEASNFPFFDFEVHCSKGTYIRSLVRDFGEACHTKATMTALRRIKSGDYTIENAIAKMNWEKEICEKLEVLSV